MKRFTTSVAAVLAATAFGALAFAQDKPTAPAGSPNPGKTQQAPKKADVQHQGQQPSVSDMDANVQRQHSRSTPAAAQSRSGGGQSQTAQAGEVRDWSAIDKNKDNLISPDEMEAALSEGRKQQ